MFSVVFSRACARFYDRDYTAAIAGFQEAIAKEPRNVEWQNMLKRVVSAQKYYSQKKIEEKAR